MSGLQTFVHGLEEGRGRFLLRLGPLVIAVAAIILFYDFSIYRGLNDAQSMDNAQLAREIARGNGFHTEFIRPYALAQLNAQAAATGSGELFHAQTFSNGVARLLPVPARGLVHDFSSRLRRIAPGRRRANDVCRRPADPVAEPAFSPAHGRAHFPAWAAAFR
jgi:hypothetical protein